MCTGSFLDLFSNNVAKDIKFYFKTPGTEANSLLAKAILLPTKKEDKNAETEDFRWKMWGVLDLVS